MDMAKNNAIIKSIMALEGVGVSYFYLTEIPNTMTLY